MLNTIWTHGSRIQEKSVDLNISDIIFETMRVNRLPQERTSRLRWEKNKGQNFCEYKHEKKQGSQVIKNLLDENEEIQERMVPEREGKRSTEASAIKWGQERGEVDNGKVVKWQK